MKALILAGGYGTRLRPLTLTIPKPLIKLCNQSILEHQVEALVKVGVNHIILAIAYKPEVIQTALDSLREKYQIKIECSTESEPLGTAGPIKLAEDLLKSGNEDGDTDESFFVLNSDVICEFPLEDVLRFHKQHKGEGTILVTEVDDPFSFGVVVHNAETGLISDFIEKPETHVGSAINAGVYVLRLSTINRIPLKPQSIERDIFPQMANEKTLYCFHLKGFWADVGQPKNFLKGMQLYLDKLEHCNHDLLARDEYIKGNVLIDTTAEVEPSSYIGPYVTIGAHCKIGKGVRLHHCVIMDNVVIESYAYLSNTIVGNQSVVSRWTRVEGLSVISENVLLESEIFVREAVVLPHKTLKESIYEPGKIIL